MLALAGIMNRPISFKLLLVLLTFSVLLSACEAKKTTPLAVKGVLDLSDWNFNQNGPVKLKGEWEFYWKQLLTPDDFSGSLLPDKTGFFPVRGKWNDKVVNGVPLTIRGYATLRLKVLMPVDTSPLVIRYYNGISAAKIWMDGELLKNVGITGKDSQTVQERTATPSIHHAGTRRDVREFVIQIASYRLNQYYGANYSVSIGKYDDLRFGTNFRTYLGSLIVGALAFMGLYHAILYLFRKKDRSNLYFSAVCFLYAFMSATYGWGFSHLSSIFGNSESYLTFYYMSEISLNLLLPAFVLFVYSLFPRECSKYVVWLSLMAGVCWGVAKIPMYYYRGGNQVIEAITLTMNHPLRPFEFIFLALMVYIIIILCLAAYRKRPNALLMLASIMLILVFGISDLLQLIYSSPRIRLLDIGFFSMIVCQSFVLSRRFSLSFSDVERLSEELKDKNISLSRLDALKDEFIANTTHELNTPLSGIIGIAESMTAGATGKLPENATRNLDMIVASGKRLSGLINNILDFSRLKHKDLALSITPIDLKVLVSIILKLLTPLAQVNGLVLKNEIPKSCPYVHGDENRLQQIFYNLIGNAIKYTEKGAITVGAEILDSQIKIYVKDTGIGIPVHKQKDIFIYFEQVSHDDFGESDSFQKPGFLQNQKGTGLGLPITKQLVELHSGTIELESVPGQGSTFFVTLPMAVNVPKDSFPQSEAKQPTQQLLERPSVIYPEPRNDLYSDHGPLILVVDDDPINLQVVMNHLIPSGYDVQTALTGQKALEMVRADVPDLLLLDVMMPHMDGYQVCRHLRETHSPSALPIIMLTAKSQLSDLVKGFDSGASDYLTKPFSRDELLARVNTQLKLKRAYNTLKENTDLKKEIELQKIKELDLVKLQQSLAYVLNSFDDAITSADSSNIKENISMGLQKINATLNQLKTALSDTPDNLEKRTLSVQLLNQALSVWQNETGLTRADLAEQSGIWKVYTTKDGFERTQTLDKYLDIKQFPKRPRSYKIYQTVDFVLASCETPSEIRDELEDSLSALKNKIQGVPDYIN